MASDRSNATVKVPVPTPPKAPPDNATAKGLLKDAPEDVEPPIAGDVRQEWETPQDLFDALNAEFRFDVDVAASVDNAKLLRFFSRTINGLKQPWDGLKVYCNPPYREIAPWVDKAVEQAMARNSTCVLLLPARTEQAWFRTVLHRASELSFFNARIQFAPPRGVAPSSNREGSILAVFGASKGGRVETVRDSKTAHVLHTWQRTL